MGFLKLLTKLGWVGWVVILIIFIGLIIFVVNLLGFLSQIFPILIGLGMIIGLGYAIHLASSSTPKNTEPEQEEDIVETCKATYSTQSDIQTCIQQGGIL